MTVRSKGGRPRVGRLIEIRLTEEQIEMLDDTAEQLGMSRAGVIRMVLDETFGLGTL